jgi:hypothetical protein
MRKITYLGMAVLLLFCLTSAVSAAKFSIGAFGGVNIPILQEDVSNGTVFGVKGRVMVMPFLGLEPNFVMSKFGDKDIDVLDQTMTRKGGDINSFGLDAVLGTFSGFSKVRFYGLAGINSNSMKRDGIPNQTRLGISIGTGLEFMAMDVLSVEVRARVHSISLEGGGGRDNVEVTGGLNYYFGPK